MFEFGLKHMKNYYKNIYHLDATDASKPEVRFAGGCKLWSIPASSSSNFLLTGPKQLGLIAIGLKLRLYFMKY